MPLNFWGRRDKKEKRKKKKEKEKDFLRDDH